MSTVETEPLLSPQFDDVDQQHDCATLGMWAFLATEVLFFGGLFLAYTVYRIRYMDAFVAASRHLNVILGAVNTFVLLTSSLTMALAVREAQLHRRKPLVLYLALTILLGAAFLGIKSIEYYKDYQDHLIPALNFDWDYAQRASEHATTHSPEPPSASQAKDTGFMELSLGSKAKLFFFLYFFMTGLHAVHLIIGIVLLGLVAVLAWRGWFSGGGASQVEVSGLYWHFIDIVWIFLYPLLYLIDVRP